VYGDRTFASRDELRAFVRALPVAAVGPDAPAAPLLLRGRNARIALVAANGRQLAHYHLPPVLCTDIQYL
jgi:hypothetical protein